MVRPNRIHHVKEALRDRIGALVEDPPAAGDHPVERAPAGVHEQEPRALQVLERRVLDRRREERPDWLGEHPHRVDGKRCSGTQFVDAEQSRGERLALRPEERHRQTHDQEVDMVHVHQPQRTADEGEVLRRVDVAVVVGQGLHDVLHEHRFRADLEDDPVDRDRHRLALRQAVEREIPAACPGCHRRKGPAANGIDVAALDDVLRP